MALNDTSLSELIKDKRDAVYVKVDTPVAEVAAILAGNKFLSAPVYSGVRGEAGSEAIACIDTFALCKFTVLGHVLETNFDNSTFSLQSVESFIRQNHGNAENKWMFHLPQVKSTASLETAMNLLSVKNHRILVDRKLVSQTDIAKYLYENKDKLSKDILHTHVSSFATKNVVKVSIESKASEGYIKCYAEQVLAVAVVNDKEELVGTLSTSDLRGITTEKLKFLDMPVLAFKQAIHSGSPPTPVICHPEATLEEVLGEILKNKVHRAWLVNKQQQIVGVCTLTDIIHFILTKGKH